MKRLRALVAGLSACLALVAGAARAADADVSLIFVGDVMLDDGPGRLIAEEFAFLSGRLHAHLPTSVPSTPAASRTTSSRASDSSARSSGPSHWAAIRACT